MERDPRPSPAGADVTDRPVPTITQERLEIETHRIVAPDGSYESDRIPDLDAEQFCDLYRWMVLQRVFDERAIKLQRRGQLGTYASGRGQEASIIGSASALADRDWLFPYGRESGALLMHGLSMRDLVLYWRGVSDGSRMRGANVFGPSISIGSQVPIVTGAAWSLDLDDADAVAFANMGDGATSTGAVHEGINFAGVLNAPAVFFCQNNQYAITLPFEEQTAAETIAQRALGYGLEGIRVDGNDVLAVYDAVVTAREKALHGNPVLVEAETYRLAAHTTSDDPTRYRSDEEERQWKEHDPIDRYRSFLRSEGLFDRIDEDELREEIRDMFDDAVDAADDFQERDVEAMFTHVHEEMPPALERQLEGYRELIEKRPDLGEYVEQRPKG